MTVVAKENGSRRGAEDAEGEIPIDQISSDVIALAIAIHRDLGPGLLESVYETLLDAKLRAKGYFVERQKSVDIVYDGLVFKNAFKIDLLVDGRLIVELKSVDGFSRAHAKQVLTYLRLTRQPVGLLINFSGETLKQGVRRLVNDYRPSASSAPLREPNHTVST